MDDARARDTVLAAFRTFSGGESPLDIQAARAPVSTNRIVTVEDATSADRLRLYRIEVQH